MSRIFKEIKVGPNLVWTLFDTGATYSYILSRYLPPETSKVRISPPVKVILGGQDILINELISFEAELNGNIFLVSAKPLDFIGYDEHGKEIQMIIGAINMEGALIMIDVRTGEINFLKQLTEFTNYNAYHLLTYSLNCFLKKVVM